MTIDKASCHIGGSNGSRAGMIMGENSGNILPNTAIGPSGSLNTAGIITIASITGMMMGIVSCCPSPMSSPMADPTAANRLE